MNITSATQASYIADSTTNSTKRQTVAAKTDKGSEPIDPLLLLLRSASNPHVATILRDSIARHFERPLISALTGPHAKERAAMILALIAGLQLFRKVIGSKALVEGNRTALSARMNAAFQSMIGGDSALDGSNLRRRAARTAPL